MRKLVSRVFLVCIYLVLIFTLLTACKIDEDEIVENRFFENDYQLENGEFVKHIDDSKITFSDYSVLTFTYINDDITFEYFPLNEVFIIYGGNITFCSVDSDGNFGDSYCGTVQKENLDEVIQTYNEEMSNLSLSESDIISYFSRRPDLIIR